ncbi:MAG: trypsin-like serine protease [Tepidisphaeraceae bacterium]
MSETYQRLIGGFCAAGVMALSQVAGAAIVAGGDGTQNTTSAGTVSQFDNVGKLNGASGIYLGDGVVLTAAHVGAGTIVLGGQSFTDVGGSMVRLHDPVFTGNLTDLVLFRINGAPALPDLSIASVTPAAGASVVMVGNGRDRAAAKTFYDVVGTTWTETTDEPNAERSGYKWLGTQTIRWALNTTENGMPVARDAGFGDVRSLVTDFDDATNQGGAAAGDSGGALFDAGGTLVGMMHAIDMLEGQPGSTAIFGNPTFAADIASYREQIIAYIPEPSAAMLLAGACAVTTMRRRRYPR